MPTILNDSFEMVAVNRLITHPRNVNQGDFGAIMESMQQHGFFGSLVVQRSTRHVLGGNHRLAVAKELGYSELPVTWVDVDDDQALRILLVDNRTARLGNDNPAKLAELLADLATTDGELSGTGYDGDFLDELIKDLAPKEPPAPKAKPDSAPEEPLRLGVIVLCDNPADQNELFEVLKDMGHEPRKTEVTEKSITSLAKAAVRRQKH